MTIELPLYMCIILLVEYEFKLISNLYNLLGKPECSDFSEESGSKNINYQVRLLFFHEYYILVCSILTIPLRGLITCWN